MANEIIEIDIPCITCEIPTNWIGKESNLSRAKENIRCTNCWEVEGRLDTYAKSICGRDYMRLILKDYGDE